MNTETSIMDTGTPVAQENTPVEGGNPPIEGSNPPVEGSNPPVEATPWTDGFSDDDLGFVQNKGYESPEALLKAYRNLNKHMGASEKNLLRMPDPGEPMDEIFARLGRPEAAKDYTFTQVEGFEGGERLDRMRETAFSKGVSQEGFQSIIDEFVSGEIEQKQAEADIKLSTFNAENESMKLEWGKDYQKKVDIADSTARAMNLSDEFRNSIRDAVGPKAAIEFLNEVGKLTGEDNINSINGEASHESTTEQMNQEIESIKEDVKNNPAKKKEYFAKGENYKRHQALQKTLNLMASED